MHLTSGFELTTAITNVFIFIVSIYGFFKIKNNTLWKLFYLFVSIDSFLGTIIYGFIMTNSANIILWLILAIFFTLTINTFLIIFLNYKIKHLIIFSILLSILMLVEIHFGLNFILTFTLYVLLALIICTYKIIKSNKKNKKYFLLGITSQFIGGIIMLSKLELSYLNHNGLYYIFMVLSMLFFLAGIEKE